MRQRQKRSKDVFFWSKYSQMSEYERLLCRDQRWKMKLTLGWGEEEEYSGGDRSSNFIHFGDEIIGKFIEGRGEFTHNQAAVEEERVERLI